MQWKKSRCGFGQLTNSAVNCRSVCLQKLPQASAANQRHPRHPEELCCLPQAEKLAVVETVHKGNSLNKTQLVLEKKLTFLCSL